MAMHATKSSQILICLLAIYLFPYQVYAEAFCNGYQYGNPRYEACKGLLLDNREAHTKGIESQDRRDHVFVPPGMRVRPAAVTANQWRNKVLLPEIWSTCVSIPYSYSGDLLTAKPMIIV